MPLTKKRNKNNENIDLINPCQASRKECVLENYFLYFSSRAYFVGTQKKCLNEMVLLSPQKKINFMLINTLSGSNLVLLQLL